MYEINFFIKKYFIIKDNGRGRKARNIKRLYLN